MAKTDLGTLELTLKANTKGLDSIVKAVGNLTKSMDNMTKKIDRSLGKLDSSYKKLANSAKNSGSTIISSSKSVGVQLARQDKAVEDNIRKFERLKRQARELGGSGGLSGLSRRLNNTNKLFKSGALDSATYQKASLKLGESFTKAGAALDKLKKVKDVQKDTKKLSDTMTDLSKSVQVALGPLSGVASRLTAITALANRNTAIFAGLIGAMIGFGAIAFKSIKAGSEFQRQIVIIDNRVRALGSTLGRSTQDLNMFAEKLARDTLIGTKEAREAIIALTSSIGLSGPHLERAAKAAADLATTGFGSLTQNAIQMARAMQNPLQNVELLRRKMVDLTDADKQLIERLTETGQLFEAQAVVLSKVEKLFGGNAATAVHTLAGAYDTLGEAILQFFEEVAVSSGVLDTLKALTEELTGSIDRMNDKVDVAATTGATLNFIIKVIGETLLFLVRNIDLLAGAIAGLALGKFVMILAKVAAGLFTAGKAAAFFNLVLKKNPLILFVSAVVGAITALTALVFVQDDVRDAQEKVTDALRRTNDEQKKATKTTTESQLRSLNVKKESLFAEIKQLEKGIQINQEKSSKIDVTLAGNTPGFSIMNPKANRRAEGFRNLSKAQIKKGNLDDDIKADKNALKDLRAQVLKVVSSFNDLTKSAAETNLKSLEQGFVKLREALTPSVRATRDMNTAAQILTAVMKDNKTFTAITERVILDTAESTKKVIATFDEWIQRFDILQTTTGKTEKQSSELRHQIVLMREALLRKDTGNFLEKFNDDLRDSTTLLQENLRMEKVSVNQKHELAVKQAVLNQLIKENIVNNRDGGNTLGRLTDIQKKRKEVIEAEIRAQFQLKDSIVGSKEITSLNASLKDQASELKILTSEIRFNSQEVEVQMILAKKRNQLSLENIKMTNAEREAILKKTEAEARGNIRNTKQSNFNDAIKQLKNQIDATNESIKAEQSLGAAKNELLVQQETLNKALELEIIIDRQGTLASQENVAQSKDRIKQIENEVRALQQRNIALAIASDQASMKKTIIGQKTELAALNSLMAINTDEMSVQLALIKKRNELNLQGVSVGSEQGKQSLALTEQTARLNLELEKQAEIVDIIRDGFDRVFDTAMNGFLDIAFVGNMTVKDLKEQFRELALDILGDIRQNSIDSMKQDLLNFITGKAGAGKIKDLSDISKANPMPVFVTNAGGVAGGGGGLESVGGFGAGGGGMASSIFGDEESSDGGGFFGAIGGFFKKIFSGGQKQQQNKGFLDIGQEGQESKGFTSTLGSLFGGITDTIVGIGEDFGEGIFDFSQFVADGFFAAGDAIKRLGDTIFGILFPGPGKGPSAFSMFAGIVLKGVAAYVGGAGGAVIAGASQGIGQGSGPTTTGSDFGGGGATGGGTTGGGSPGGSSTFAATGADFMVGGTGGTDSQFVPMRLTPGERVTVRTPMQQQAMGGSSGGSDGGIHIGTIDMRGADVETVMRLESTLKKLNVNFDRRAIIAVSNANSRNPKLLSTLGD